MTLIELLSPAKDLETGLAAINCGADAVYIGASLLGQDLCGNDHEILHTASAWALYALRATAITKRAVDPGG